MQEFQKPSWCGLLDDSCWHLEQGEINVLADCVTCDFIKLSKKLQKIEEFLRWYHNAWISRTKDGEPIFNLKINVALMKPTIEKLIEEGYQIEIKDAEVDTELLEKLNVMSIPVIVKDDKILHGIQSRESVIEFIS